MSVTAANQQEKIHDIVSDSTHANPKRTVAIAIDESAHSDYCVKWAIEHMIQPESDQVVLLHCREDSPYSGVSMSSPYLDMYDIIRKVDENNKHHSHELLKEKGKLFLSKKISARAISLKGDPKHEIVAKVDELNPDVLIMASRGMGAIKRTLIGSVSDYCVHHARCPVLVTKIKDEKK